MGMLQPTTPVLVTAPFRIPWTGPFSIYSRPVDITCPQCGEPGIFAGPENHGNDVHLRCQLGHTWTTRYPSLPDSISIQISEPPEYAICPECNTRAVASTSLRAQQGSIYEWICGCSHVWLTRHPRDLRH